MRILIAILFLTSSCVWADFSSMGEVAFEYRQFEDDNVTTTEDRGLAVFSRVESRYEEDYYSHVLRAFARIDSQEASRDLIWVEDAYAAYFLDVDKLWRVSGGYKVFNWTALEAFRPADTINSRNLDAPLEKPEKRGELALELEVPFYEGALTFSLFPRVENPHFPGAASRLGLGFTPATPVWVDGLKATTDQWRAQYAARLNQFIFGADLSLHLLQHYDRQFPIVGTTHYAQVLGNLVPLDGVASMNVPHYFQVTQFGGTFARPFFDGWVLKAEAVHRSFEKDLEILTASGLKKPLDHSEAALGLEYGLAHADGSESTFYLEAVSLFGVTKEERASLAAFQKDVFVGFRHALNDVMGTEFLVSAIFDLERTHEKLYNIQASRRLSDIWKLSGTLRVFDASPENQTPLGLEILDQDNHAGLTITRYF